MEAITQLVADSLARHGMDRPVDPRRLQWSRWFRCDSTHSLLVVPSKPGIFALAEEVMNFGGGMDHGETGEPGFADGSSVNSSSVNSSIVNPSRESSRRMLAVLQFSEDDDMAFTLDRMFTCVNPLRGRLASGRCFLRFVVIQDQAQRRGICNALNQWVLSSAGKASGLPADFSSSLELAPVTAGVARTPSSAFADTATLAWTPDVRSTDPHQDSGAVKNLHCPHSLPSGF